MALFHSGPCKSLNGFLILSATDGGDEIPNVFFKAKEVIEMGWVNTAGYEIMRQTQRSSCGMACVCMVVHRKGMGKPTEGLVAAKSKKMPLGYGQALQDRFKGNPRMLTATSDPVPARGYEGTYMDNLSAILTEWKIVNKYKHHPNVMGSLQSVRAGSPAIAQVDWNGGTGSHFVLIEKFQAGPKGLIICDPYYGLSAMSANGAATYKASDGSSGTFNGWLITT